VLFLAREFAEDPTMSVIAARMSLRPDASAPGNTVKHKSNTPTRAACAGHVPQQSHVPRRGRGRGPSQASGPRLTDLDVRRLQLFLHEGHTHCRSRRAGSPDAGVRASSAALAPGTMSSA